MLWLDECSVLELSDQEGQQSESLLKDCEKLKIVIQRLLRVCDSDSPFSGDYGTGLCGETEVCFLFCELGSAR